MKTLNDEWLMERILERVEEIGRPLGYHLVRHDAGECIGKKASWHIKKDGCFRQIPFEPPYPDYSVEAIQCWLRSLTF